MEKLSLPTLPSKGSEVKEIEIMTSNPETTPSVASSDEADQILRKQEREKQREERDRVREERERRREEMRLKNEERKKERERKKALQAGKRKDYQKEKVYYMSHLLSV